MVMLQQAARSEYRPPPTTATAAPIHRGSHDCVLFISIHRWIVVWILGIFILIAVLEGIWWSRWSGQPTARNSPIQLSSSERWEIRGVQLDCTTDKVIRKIRWAYLIGVSRSTQEWISFRESLFKNITHSEFHHRHAQHLLIQFNVYSVTYMESR